MGGDLTKDPGCGKILFVGDRVEFVYEDLTGRVRASLLCHVAGNVVQWRQPHQNVTCTIGRVERIADQYCLLIPLPPDWEPAHA